MARESKVSKMLAQYRSVFGTPAGKAVLMDMMKSNHVLDSTFVPGDPCLTALREGERNAVLKVLTILKINPEKVLEMVNTMEDTHVD